DAASAETRQMHRNVARNDIMRAPNVFSCGCWTGPRRAWARTEPARQAADFRPQSLNSPESWAVCTATELSGLEESTRALEFLRVLQGLSGTDEFELETHQECICAAHAF